MRGVQTLVEVMSILDQAECRVTDMSVALPLLSHASKKLLSICDAELSSSVAALQERQRVLLERLMNQGSETQSPLL